jgi:hypothetical protein
MTNFDAHLFESEAQQDARAIRALKGFFQARQLARSGAMPQALASYEEALPIWLDMFLEYPRFRRVLSVMEDFYEAELKYLRYLQTDKASTLRTVSMIVAQLGCWPNWPPFDTPFEKLLTDSQKLAIIPIRRFYGPMDRILVFDVDHMLQKGLQSMQDQSYEAELKRLVLTWSQMGLPFPMLVYPGQANRILSHVVAWPETPPSSPWQALVPVSTIDMVRQRMNLPTLVDRRTPPVGMQGMPDMPNMPPPGMKTP